MEVLKARFTDDFKMTKSPTCTGTRKSRWSMDAVTTKLFEWRWAARAPEMSIQCIKRPPSSAPSGLVSLGRTISIISERLSRTGRPIRGVDLSLISVFQITGRRLKAATRLFGLSTTRDNTAPCAARSDSGAVFSTRMPHARNPTSRSPQRHGSSPLPSAVKLSRRGRKRPKSARHRPHVLEAGADNSRNRGCNCL